ncbi:MAG TPA: hypothetical protein VJC13_03625 [Candidatus Paceibacterota bacterium]
MQIIPSKGNIIEKVLRDKEGRIVCARFFVYESQGRIKARLVDFKYLEESIANNEVLVLSCYIPEDSYFIKVFEKGIVSPFVQGLTLYLSGSKPRAPTFL